MKSRIIKVAPVNLHTIPEATVHGLDGVIVAPDRCLLSDLVPSEVEVQDHPVFRRLRFARPRPIRGLCTSLVQPLARNYFHWLLECLPVLGATNRLGNVLDQILIRANPAAFQLETLERLGYGRSELVEVSVHEAVRCERLLQPTFMNAWAMPAWVPGWLRSTFVSEKVHQASRRMYVSRNDASARRVINEHEILDALRPLGFERVILGGLTFSQQAVLFDAAEIVVGPHGAGLANTVFCRPGTRVVEIFPDRWTPLCYMRVARRVGLNYRFITSGGVGFDDTHRDEVRKWIPEDQSLHLQPFQVHGSKVLALAGLLRKEQSL